MNDMFQAYDFQTNSDVKKRREYVAKLKYKNLVCKKAHQFNDIVGQELNEGEQVRIITDNSFNAISILEFVTEKYNVEEVYLAIYRMNIKAVFYLTSLIDNYNLQINIIISSFFRENKKYEKWVSDLFSYCEGRNNVKLKADWNHAKVFLAKTKCGKHIVFEGSGNLSDNARIEQYLYENNKQSYEFHKSWMNSIIND